MAWTSSTAVVGIGADGALGTTSNNALIVGDDWGNFLEVCGANDTVIGGAGNDSIGAILYPALGMNGTNVYINGSYGNDAIAAMAIQGELNATLAGAVGIETFRIGCNQDSTINVVFEDLNPAWDSVGVFYEGGNNATFTCYSSDKGLIFRDDAGRLNVTVKSVFAYDELNGGVINFSPGGYRGNGASVNWREVSIVDLVNYGGYLSGVTVTDTSIVLNDCHNGGVITNGVSGLDNIITIDNSQCRDGRFLGGNAQNNYIFAGAGGDTLWGAAGNDILVGGAGADNFVYNAGEGADLFLQTDWLDTVTLNDLTLDNIAVFVQGDAVAVATYANNSAVIQYNGVYSPLIKLADGSAWRYKSDDNTWINF